MFNWYNWKEEVNVMCDAHNVAVTTIELVTKSVK